MKKTQLFCFLAAVLMTGFSSTAWADNASVSAAPTAIDGLVYTGLNQALVNAGTAEGGTMLYSLDNTNWDAAVPTAKNAGDYTVYFMVQGDATHADYTPADNTVNVSIAKAPLTIKADNATLYYGDPAWWCNHATYSGFVNGEGVTVLSGAVQFNNEYTDGSNAGTYTITPYGVTAANYDITFVPGTVTVHKVASVITTTPTAIDGLVANGSAQTLINAGEATGGEMQYSLDNLNWSTDLPTATDANTYIVYYKVVGDINHYNTYAASLSVTIAASAPTFIVITANADPDHAGVYYATFFDSSNKYALSNDGTEAYAAEVSGDAMYLHKIAKNNDVLPANTAVIFKATGSSITLTASAEEPVAVTATNHLRGVDAETDIEDVVLGTCYVLSGHSSDNSVVGVGYYRYDAPNKLKAHKAYIDLNGSGMAQAPKRLRFVFDSAQGIEDVQSDKVQCTKVMENGVLYIMYNGTKYNVQGQVVRE